MIKDPIVIQNILSEEDFLYLKNHFYFNKFLKNISFDGECGRKLIHSTSDPVLIEYSNKILPKVREYFQENDLLHTYSLFSEYSDSKIFLDKHMDANACTYTVDLALYHNNSWGLWINNKEYIAEENDAILFCGENYEHWREPIENNKDRIGVIFFHYAKPDHWWFTEGPEYVKVIRDKIIDNRNTGENKWIQRTGLRSN